VISRVALLPGLDGTGTLFRRFIETKPSGVEVTEVELPPDRVLTFDELAGHVRSMLPDERLVLLGESFSGPLALRLANRVNPLAVILCASFVRAPAALRLAAAPLSFLSRARPPVAVVKAQLSGGDEEIANDLVRAVATAERKVIASRVRMTLEVDTVPDLLACRCPILYLRATRDLVVSKRQADLIRATRADVTVAEIDGPHLLLQTRPKECWARIGSFLERPGDDRERLEVTRHDVMAPIAQALIAELNRELLAIYPEEGATHFRLDPDEVSEARGAFLVAFVAGEPVGCGAVRRLDTETAEIKRMYVKATMRGRGVASRILDELVSEARRLGVNRIVLETGERQPDALALYGGAGFVRIPLFGEYVDSPLSVCMAKEL
jgi:putative acetyltransferase